MTPPTKNPSAQAVGYLLATEDPSYGYTAALLLVCDRGRPLEFHCTEPIRPSRAQQILFGPTLREHVIGDQLGGALLAAAKLPIGRLLVRDGAAAAAGRAAGLPTTILADGAVDATPPEGVLAALAETIDLAEPFERVAEAIRETQRMVVGEGSADAAEEAGREAA